MSDVGGEQVQTEPVQVCEGRWRTRDGNIRNVTPTPECDNRHDRFPWRDTAYDQTWTPNGRYQFNGEDSPLDLIRYLGPIEPQSEPQPEPVPEPVPEPQAADTAATGYTPPEGWRVLAVGEILQAGDMWVNHEGESRPTKRVGERVNDELYIRCDPIEPEPQPQPQPVPEHLQAIIAAQAETIARLQSEAHELNMEIGGLQRNLSERQARIRDLETMHAAATQAVVDAGKENDKLRAQADELRSEVSNVQWLLGESRQRVTHLEELVTSLRNSNKAQEKAFTAAGKANTDLQHRLNVVSAEWAEQSEINRRLQSELNSDASVSRLQADRNDLAGKVISLREQLQQANDRLAQLEVLQPIAAACHTAQTMVRDMLGHMRCLLALQHTTDRRDSCTLLESILEVFDDAECDEDEDEDTTNTSEAGQG